MIPPAPFPRTTIAATVAGTDSGGGAGIQADLKSFAACGVYGVSVAVALTAQNTLGVLAAHGLPQDFVVAQFEALDQDLRPKAVKTGMLFSAAHIATVCQQLRQRSWGPLVVDPVMVAKSGAILLEKDAVAIMREELLPLAELVTPNWPEAAVLAGIPVESEADAIAAGRAILDMGASSVVVKGGHAPGEPTDLLISDQGLLRLSGVRIDSVHTHGTGCTFSAAITARLALGDDLELAVDRAKEYVTAAIRHAPGLGSGHGPLEHFPPLQARPESDP
ncbi:MAG: bifunctional hydroxymethylpyrimidine kinase/phosphomethylpyrimidine kinase [Candidatus Dormibacteria bacterium]|jgi:hydroxymethylpyrimidine kinase/phosphomethylpyrimidine kinase